MLRFEYTARHESGTAATGEIVAANRAEAARMLRSEGKFVVRLVEIQSETNRREPARVGSRRVKEDQIIYFTNQLAVMVDTGVPLAEALSATIEDEPPSGFRKVIEDVITHIQGGQEFSSALARHPRVFPKYYVNIIKASEASGLLGTMLQRIAAYMTNQRDIKKRIIHAMIYPVVMILFCIVIAIFLLTYLMPKFTRIFTARHAALPAPTQFLLNLSNFLAGNWQIIVPILLLGAGSLWYFLKSGTGFRVVSWLKIHLPVLGPIFRKTYLTRCMRTMGTLIDSGVSMLDTVSITRNVIDNFYYQDVFEKIDEQLQKGNLLSDSLRGNQLIPHTAAQMILAGERAGQLGPVMNRVADFCEQDLSNAIRSATQMIEPLLVIFMGVFIGCVVIALLLPIFTLSRVVSGG